MGKSSGTVHNLAIIVITIGATPTNLANVKIVLTKQGIENLSEPKMPTFFFVIFVL